jgi:metallo-beta-lactamase family protein
MLYDSAYIQERDVEFVNKKHLKRGEPPVDPLYSTDDVDQTMEQMVGIGYRQRIELAEGISITFFDAGHVLGSAVSLTEIRENGRITRLGFTGDLGRKNMPILKDPDPVGDVDILISESTYGARIHEPIAGMEDRLADVFRRTFDRGGKVIVPAFSAGKTQEFLYVLFTLNDSGRLPSVPIFVDSPLSVNTTEVFRLHPECFDRETNEYIRRQEDPFGFGRLKYIRSVEDSKKLNDLNEPCIIIASSGMCEAGRILHHLANNIHDPRHTVLVIGYMAEHTLGRRIVERQPVVRIFGETYRLQSEVAVLNAFSGHAGQDELVAYVQGMDRRVLKDIFLVHGELPQAQALSAKLAESGYSNIRIPSRGEKAEF